MVVDGALAAAVNQRANLTVERGAGGATRRGGAFSAGGRVAECDGGAREAAGRRLTAERRRAAQQMAAAGVGARGWGRRPGRTPSEVGLYCAGSTLRILCPPPITFVFFFSIIDGADWVIYACFSFVLNIHS